MKPPSDGSKPDELIRFSIEQGNATPVSTPRTPRNSSMSLSIRGPSDTAVEEQRTYEFTDIFPPNASDSAVERVVVPRVVDQVRQGYNAAVMCYGQTGSGKTWTVNALTPKLIEAVFSMLESDECKEYTHVVSMSYLQIYNNSVYNLLTDSKAELGEALPKPKGTIVAEPMTTVKSAAETAALIAGAQRRRVVAPHAMNTRSSRSHTLLSLVITKLVDGTPVQSSRLTIADLAGSERLKKTGVAGDGVDEAICINKSLSALARVIEAAGTHTANVPIRDNVLTLYLAQSLQDSYMFLVATIAMEAVNLSETKSTLEFALMARKCVVQRMKTSVGTRDATFDEMQRQLTNEVNMLRVKVEELQRDADLERRRNAVLQGRLEQRSTSTSEAAVQEGHIRQLERDAMQLNNLLREREEELRSLEKRREALETVSADIGLRESEKAEARETLASSCAEGGISQDDVAVLKAKLERVNDAFLWQEDQLKAAADRNRLAESTIQALQAECHKIRADLHSARQSSLAWEREAVEQRTIAKELNAQLNEIQMRFDALELQLLRERNDFKARQITIETYCSARNASDEVKSLDKALAEQSKLLDSVQARLTSCEQELFETDKARSEWESRAHAADRLYEELWSNLSAAEKVRFMRSDRQPSGGTSFDAVALRNGLTRANLKCEELTAQLRAREAQIDDLEATVRELQEARDVRDREFVTLQSLEEAHSLRGEQLELQLEELYREIDAHIVRRDVLEAHLKETHAEWERLDHEFRESQKEIDVLTNKLDDALQKLRHHEQTYDDLTARLRQAEEQKDSFKKRRDEEHARVIELERQLREKELRINEVKQLRDEVAVKNRSIFKEVKNSMLHSALVATKLERLQSGGGGSGAGFSNVRRKLQAQRQVNEGLLVASEPTHHGKQLAEQTKRRQLRFEVSQLRRPSGAGVGEYKDPMLGLSPTVPPPPPVPPPGSRRNAGAPGVPASSAAGGGAPIAAGSASPSAPMPPPINIADVKRFANAQRSPRGLNARTSLVQQAAMHRQQAADMQAVAEPRQPAIPALALVQMQSRGPTVPPLSLGKRPLTAAAGGGGSKR